jgi:hypothetical protein
VLRFLAGNNPAASARLARVGPECTLGRVQLRFLTLGSTVAMVASSVVFLGKQMTVFRRDRKKLLWSGSFLEIDFPSSAGG